MAALVPAAVGRGAVEHAVDDKEGNCGPASPKMIAEASGHYERCDPDQRIPDRRTVLATHQPLKLRALDRRRVPFRRREPGRDGLIGLRADEAVIASDGRGGHSSPPPKAAAHKPTLSVTQLRLNAAFIFILPHPLESGGSSEQKSRPHSSALAGSRPTLAAPPANMCLARSIARSSCVLSLRFRAPRARSDIAAASWAGHREDSLVCHVLLVAAAGERVRAAGVDAPGDKKALIDMES